MPCRCWPAGARGELAEAEAACRWGEESTTWFHSRVWIATAHETRALLARAEGNIELAVDQFEQAQAGFAALGQPFDEARCLANVETARLSKSTPTKGSSPSTQHVGKAVRRVRQPLRLHLDADGEQGRGQEH